jgi:hypothetical protein
MKNSSTKEQILCSNNDQHPSEGSSTLTQLNGKIKRPSIILATRIHLGKQSKPPEQSHLTSILTSFLQTSRCIQAAKSVIAVDSQERIKGYDLVQAIQIALQDARNSLEEKSSGDDKRENDAIISCPISCEILDVTPWGNFIPALNALTMWACQNQIDYGNTVIMFISAETCITKKETVDALTCHMDQDTLVVGAVLPGHDYKGNNTLKPCTATIQQETDMNDSAHQIVALNGRTCPWNTLAIWNLNKLALVGFPLVSEGIHRDQSGAPVAAGIEEVATVLLHQKIHGALHNRAKLVKVDGVEWEEDFRGDEKRKQWHEVKMKSKHDRAEVQRYLLGGIEGVVYHL